MKQLEEIIIEQTSVICAISQLLINKGILNEVELDEHINGARKLINKHVEKNKQEAEEALMKSDPLAYAFIKGLEKYGEQNA